MDTLLIQIKQMSIVPKRASPAFAASLKATTFFYQPEQLHSTQIGAYGQTTYIPPQNMSPYPSQFLLQFSIKIKPRKIRIKYSNSSKIRITSKKNAQILKFEKYVKNNTPD
jgi:hypothetical protein